MTWPIQANAMTKTSAQAAPNTFVPIIWLNELLIQREANLVVAKNFLRINHKGKPGDTIRIPFISDLTAYQKVATNPVTIQAIPEGMKTITLDQHWEVSYLEEDFLKIQSDYNLMQAYAKKAAYALTKKVDSLLSQAIFNALGSNYLVSGTDGSTPFAPGNEGDLTDAALRRAVRKLDDNDVPEDDRFWIIPPSQKEVLLGIDKFVLYQNIGDTKALRKGLFGELYGAPVYVTTNLHQNGNAKMVIYGHKEGACSAIQQDIRYQASYKQEYLATLCTSDMIFGVKALRTDNDDNSQQNRRKSHIVGLMVPAA